MAIPVQCPECHKRYQAPDRLAGRRVKCKFCGVVFLIAGDSRTENPDFDLAQLDELSALGDTGAPARRAPVGAGGAAAGSDTPLSRSGILGGGDDVDDVFGRAEFSEAGAPRTNKLYIFPMSRLLDRWLPPLLLAIGIVWVCREAWTRNPTGQAWVGPFRAGVLLLAFFAAVFPFTRMGIGAAARRLNFELPPRINLRVLGAFAVPAALAAVLWLIYEDVAGVLLGTAIGVAVALPVLFLLLRLLPREAPVTFGYAAGSFVLSVLVTCASLFALNVMLVGILRSLKTDHALRVSPFGPGLRWEEPRRGNPRFVQGGDGEDEEQEGPATTQGVASPATDSSGAIVTRQPAPGVSTTHLATEPAETDARRGDGGPATVERPAVGPSVATAPPEGAVRPAVPRRDPPDAGSPTARTVSPFIPEGAGANAVRPKRGGIVKDVRTVIEGDDITQFIRPVVSGPWVAVVRPGVRGMDRVERWNTATWKPAGEAQLARDPDEGNAYSLSPDGDLLAYITDFPSLSVQVWSFGAGRFVREIRLKTNPRDDWGEPRLLGFSRPDRLVIHWRRGDLSGLQVHGVKAAGPPPRHFGVEDFDSASVPGSYAFSPDGQAITLLWRDAQTGGLSTYVLSTSKLVRSFPIGVLDWRLQLRPAALAYTPDGSQVAAIIEEEGQGQGLFTLWPATGKPTRPLAKHVVPVGVPGGGNGFNAPFEGQAFDWIDGGKAYLMYGSAVFETDGGRFLGDIGMPNVRAQLGGGGDRCDLVRSGDAGRVQVDAVTLHLSKARGNAEAAGQRSTAPSPPATRRTLGSVADDDARPRG